MWTPCVKVCRRRARHDEFYIASSVGTSFEFVLLTWGSDRVSIYGRVVQLVRRRCTRSHCPRPLALSTVTSHNGHINQGGDLMCAWSDPLGALPYKEIHGVVLEWIVLNTAGARSYFCFSAFVCTHVAHGLRCVYLPCLGFVSHADTRQPWKPV